MGLSIYEVNKDFKYEDEEFEYNSMSVGYFSWKWFRDYLIEYCTNGKIKSLECLCALTGEVPYDKNTLAIVLDIKMFENGKNFAKYKNFLIHIKSKMPKLYSCLGIILHSDCEGFVPYEQVKSCYPVIKECLKYKLPDKLHKINKNDLLKILKSATENEHKLQFA